MVSSLFDAYLLKYLSYVTLFKALMLAPESSCIKKFLLFIFTVSVNEFCICFSGEWREKMLKAGSLSSSIDKELSSLVLSSKKFVYCWL